jgi:formylmethanofuran dehydrogenase subunit C
MAMNENSSVFLECFIKETIPVEAPCLTPGSVLGRSEKEIASLPVLVGNRNYSLGDIFRIRRSGDDSLVVSGNLGHVKRIGEKMDKGILKVRGVPGMHLGEEMSGGQLLVDGDIPDWCLCGMSGGLVHVNGSAGNRTAAALPGESRGMKGGVVVIMGNTGSRTGDAMRRGLIAVGGSAAEFAGSRMVAGTMVVFGRLARRAGGGMKRGTIIALGGADEILPSFVRACRYRPSFVPLYMGYLAKLGLPVDINTAAGDFVRWTGDCTSLGKGEILEHEAA